MIVPAGLAWEVFASRHCAATEYLMAQKRMWIAAAAPVQLAQMVKPVVQALIAPAVFVQAALVKLLHAAMVCKTVMKQMWIAAVAPVQLAQMAKTA